MIKEQTKFISKFFGIFIIVILGFLIYSNSLHGEFVFDDLGYILNNTAIRNLSDVKSIWHALAHPSRFVGFYTFALNYHFHQYDVFGYHVVNVVIHILVALIVWWFVYLIYSSPCLKQEKSTKHKQAISFFTALIFLCHPIQTQAVSYLTQRLASLATLFYVLTLCLYLSGRLRNKKDQRAILYFLGAGLSALLGMFTKQIIFTVPFSILLLEGFILRDFSVKLVSKLKKMKPLLVVLALFICIIPAMFHFSLGKIFGMTTASGSHNGDIINSFNYFLTQSRVILTYLKLLFFPVGLNLDYDFALSQSLLEGTTFISFCILGYILVMGCKLYKKNVLLSYSIFWFFLTLSVESSIIPIRHVIFEHRMYLSSIGFILFIVVLMFQKIRSLKVAYSVSVGIVIVLSLLTYQRNTVWQTDISLWSDVVKKSPHKARPHNNLGYAYLKKGYDSLAFFEINQAIKLDKYYFEAYGNRGLLFQNRGEYDLALNDYKKALNINSGYVEAYNNSGNIYMMRGQLGLAKQNFDRALFVSPYYVEALINRAQLQSTLGLTDKALEDYNLAIKYNPNFSQAYNGRAVVYMKNGRLDDGIRDFSKAVELNPHNQEALKNRDMALKQRSEMP